MKMATYVYGIAIVIALFVLQKLYRSWQLYQLSKRYACKSPPRHKPYDILGLWMPIHIAQLFRNRQLLHGTHSLFERYSGTFKARIVGQDYVFTCDPRNNKHILSTQFGNFDTSAKRDHLLQDISTKGILNVDGPAWVASREQIRRQFSNTRAIVDFEMLERQFNTLAMRLSSKKDAVDMQKWSGNLMMDVFTKFTTGSGLDSLAVDQGKEDYDVDMALRTIKDTIARKGFFGPAHHMVGGKQFKLACASVKNFINRLVSEFEGISISANTNKSYYPVSRQSLLSRLMAEEKDLTILKDQLSNILIAGYGALTTTLSMSIYLLANKQHVLQKLRTEISDTCGKSPPTFDDLKKMTFLRDVVNETLRIYPPVPLNMRTANKDTTLPSGGGPHGTSPIVISRGQSVLFSSFSSHRWIDYYGDDPESFRPERWQSLKVNDPSYLPFLYGPRGCPGQPYGLTVCSYMLARFIQTYEGIESADERAWVEKISMTLFNENGAWVTLT